MKRSNFVALCPSICYSGLRLLVFGVMRIGFICWMGCWRYDEVPFLGFFEVIRLGFCWFPATVRMLADSVFFVFVFLHLISISQMINNKKKNKWLLDFIKIILLWTNDKWLLFANIKLQYYYQLAAKQVWTNTLSLAYWLRGCFFFT